MTEMIFGPYGNSAASAEADGTVVDRMSTPGPFSVKGRVVVSGS